MWRKVGAALVAAAVGATPVLAIETASPPATVPAKITRLASKSTAKNSSTKTASITGKIKVPRNHRATRIAAKVGNKSAHQLRNKVGKAGINHKYVADAAKGSNLRPNVHPKQSWRQHAKLLPKRKGVEAAEPVETTGSVAPRSVPAPGLY
jgi:cell envelope opacity-associated protein A